MSRLAGAHAPGVVGAIRRRVGLRLETLVLCDTARGDGAPTGSRGFYRLLDVGQGQRRVLGPPIKIYEPVTSSGALRPYNLRSFLACAAFCAGSGLTFFSEGHEIRTLDASNVLGRVICDLQFCYPSAFAIPEPETLWVTDAHGLHVLRLLSTSDGVVATSVSFRSHDEDWRGHVGVACADGWQVMFSATCTYKVSDADGGWQLWAGNEDLCGVADGAGEDARFSSITAVGIDGNGAALVLDAQHDGRTIVRHVDNTGYVNTVYSPAPLDEVELNEIDSRGDLLSCDSGLASASGVSAACTYTPVAATEQFESTFRGGGLRCPLVLDDLLVLCAPLQDTILFLHVPGLRELSCHSGRLSLARACTSASCPTAQACYADNACCGDSADRMWSYDLFPSCDDTASCGGSGSSKSGCAAHQRNGNRHGMGAKGRLRDGRRLRKPAFVGAVQMADEDEVSSQVSYVGNGGFLGMRSQKRPAPRGLSWKGNWTGKRSAARKRFHR